MVSVFLFAFLVSLVYLFSFYYLLVTELVPQDQKYIPKRKVGDKISVYGVWVQDNELAFLFNNNGWHEIHPVRYAEINGVRYGSINYNGSLFDGVYEPERFVVLDKKNPYRITNGTVMDVFTNPSDGDYHIHLLVDYKYKELLKIDFVIFPHGELLRLMSLILPSLIIISYLIVSIIKPRHTLMGRYTLRLKSKKSSNL
ncbi:MAG TPA: hypothetical protein VFS97_04490 [Nitrososphaeraceae archaeon]|nr:hypothetical protein [Nitrososphaeraceae archaeon]